MTYLFTVSFYLFICLDIFLILIGWSFVLFFLFVVYPSNSLAFDPLPEFFLSVLEVIVALAMLLSIFPGSNVLSAVSPVKNPLSLFFVVFVLSFVPSSVGPFYFPVSMHFVVLPFTHILSIFAPNILA